MDYYYHILVTWAMPLMIFLINLRSYPIRLVLLHPHHLQSIGVNILFYHHIVNPSRHHHHHQLHPPTASSNVVESYFKIPHQHTTNTVIINTNTVSTTMPSSDSSRSRSTWLLCAYYLYLIVTCKGSIWLKFLLSLLTPLVMNLIQEALSLSLSHLCGHGFIYIYIDSIN